MHEHLTGINAVRRKVFAQARRVNSAGLSKTSIPVLTGAPGCATARFEFTEPTGVLSVRPVRVLKPIPQQLEKAVPLLQRNTQTLCAMILLCGGSRIFILM